MSGKGVEFDQEFTREHVALLYLISKYSHEAIKEDEFEQYIRHFALRTFIYEGIMKKIFDYDYAPMSVELFGGRRYVNISQEGEDDLVDLRDNHLIECLKVTSTNYLPLSAFRINRKGLDAMAKALTPEIKAAVDKLVTCPVCNSLLEVRVHLLFSEDQKKAIDVQVHCRDCTHTYSSTIADIESVSYCSSPYIPKIPRMNPTLDEDEKECI